MKELPLKIKMLLEDEKYIIDKVGMSESTVLLFKDKVLKIQNIDVETENEHMMMKWLSGRIPVPEVLAYECENHKSFLLMTRLSGEMACSDTYMRNPGMLIDLLANALHLLWDVDITNCPSIFNLDRKLQQAQDAVEHSMIGIEDAEPDTYGKDGFSDPNELLEWLIENRPEEELVLSHGDFCLPNICFSKREVAGFIDLGKTGIADRWQDIALCYRSLAHDFDGRYSGMKYEGFHPELLFEKLKIEPDWDKIRYYILLDELF